MNQDNPTLELSENQQVSPLLFNKIFNDVTLAAEEKTRLLADASRSWRRVFFETYDKAPVHIQAAIQRDYCEAMACLLEKYEPVITAALRAEGGTEQ